MAGAMANPTITMDRMPKGTTLHVTVAVAFSRQLRLRIWVAAQIFRLGAWVLGVPIVMEEVASTEAEQDQGRTPEPRS